MRTTWPRRECAVVIVTPPIWLASRSPRRKLLLEQAGVDVIIKESDIDDALLQNPGVPAEHWVMALAHMKARRVADDLVRESPGACGTVLGADTVCVVDREILGQPRDADDARRMMSLMRDRWHHTLTGVCLIVLPSRQRQTWFDRTEVHIGEVSDEQLDQYVRGGEWRGKAGGYNLSERLDAGWPIDVRGDPATVMGLPMRRLLHLISNLRESRR